VCSGIGCTYLSLATCTATVIGGTFGYFKQSQNYDTSINTHRLISGQYFNEHNSYEQVSVACEFDTMTYQKTKHHSSLNTDT
jgi:hypothetical protein